MTYLRLASFLIVAAVIASLAAAAFWYRGQAAIERGAADKYQLERDTAVAANAQQQKTIDDLREQSRKNNVILANLAAEIAGLNETAQETQQAIMDIGSNDEPSRNYLNTPVPDPLRMRLEQ